VHLFSSNAAPAMMPVAVWFGKILKLRIDRNYLKPWSRKNQGVLGSNGLNTPAGQNIKAQGKHAQVVLAMGFYVACPLTYGSQKSVQQALINKISVYSVCSVVKKQPYKKSVSIRVHPWSKIDCVHTVALYAFSAVICCMRKHSPAFPAKTPSGYWRSVHKSFTGKGMRPVPASSKRMTKRAPEQ
jgi:hypothetical protein